MAFVVATYRYRSPDNNLTEASVQKLAEKIAVGQTLGTNQPEVLARLSDFVGHVVSVHLENLNVATFKVAFPTPQVIPADLAMLLSITFGKVSMLGNLQLLDLELPDELANQFRGPRFGVDGIRRKLNHPDQPFLMSIFKPCVGLSAPELAGMLEEQAEGGCHLVMDDELLADADSDTALRRVEACRVAIDRVAEKTGHRLLYAPHLTGPAHELIPRAKSLVQAGAEAFLFSYWCYGLPLLSSIASDDEIGVPILGHPALAGAFYGAVAQPLLFGLLPRLAGCDLVLSPSPEGNIRLEKSVVSEMCYQLRKPIGSIKPALPVPSAGIASPMVPNLLDTYGHDVVINAGTGIYDHPAGPKAAIAEFLAAMQVSEKALV